MSHPVTIACAAQIHLSEPEGDILLFLTGQDEIDRCAGGGGARGGSRSDGVR